MKNKQQFDVIIVGGSYSGLSAGMALGRALRTVLIIDSGNPCNKQTPNSHNFLTNDGRTPKEIADVARQQVEKYDTVSFIKALAVSADKTNTGFEVQLNRGARYFAKKLVFATGIRDVLPPIPGFAECWGISVLHCPYCHGYEVRHQKTGILANGDLAFELSSLVYNWTQDLILYTNGKSTLTEFQQASLGKHGIDIVHKEIVGIEHNYGVIQRIHFSDGSDDTITALYSRLPFAQSSGIPGSLGCELTADGYILTDTAQRTSVRGVYACGDNTSKIRTVANAVSIGTTAALMLNREYIDDLFNSQSHQRRSK